MDMYQLKWTRLQSEIFRLLCIRAGQALSLRETARALKVSPTAVSGALAGIGDYAAVKKSKTMNLLSISLNRDSQKTIQMKRVENLKMVYESGLSDFLFNEFPGCAVILFGSYSKGEDTYFSEENRSDIDVAIIGRKEKGISLESFDRLLERKVSINFYESWKGIHKHLKDSILNGIILSGGIDL
jgi:predicted nucleotidyltransferase